MGETGRILKEQIKKYDDLMSNKDIPVKETWNTYTNETKTEFDKAKDLNHAKQERKTAISKRLNALREEAGEKQRDVADAIGVNVITLSGYEVGRSEPNAEVFVRLADFYKVSLDYILCRTDTKIVFDQEEYRAKDEERKIMGERLKQLENELLEIRDAIKK